MKNRNHRRCAGSVAIAVVGFFVFSIPQIVLAQNENADSNQYLVKPGDQLLISVWKEEDLQQEVLVRPDGGFSFPLAGNLIAAGKSVEKIGAELKVKLERFIPDLAVTVAVVAINGNKIYVIGQVNNPGAFVMNPRIDVMQALSMAGGTTTFAALNNIVILRRTATGQTAISFRYGDIEKGRSLAQNIMLQSGDVVVVP